ncbi:hypothetical protein KC19_10G082800 [Ceratodon purpureus]|uniref:Uncharacterized protein n=1 Tax=Ceratodon purpureus TaxID=3225 RepID=A0A8T0GKR2_CERPU|nr:hypothetical protein KC19_10G082800 [Ceratodon purpureus]
MGLLHRCGCLLLLLSHWGSCCLLLHNWGSRCLHLLHLGCSVSDLLLHYASFRCLSHHRGSLLNGGSNLLLLLSLGHCELPGGNLQRSRGLLHGCSHFLSLLLHNRGHYWGSLLLNGRHRCLLNCWGSLKGLLHRCGCLLLLLSHWVGLEAVCGQKGAESVAEESPRATVPKAAATSPPSKGPSPSSASKISTISSHKPESVPSPATRASSPSWLSNTGRNQERERTKPVAMTSANVSDQHQAPTIGGKNSIPADFLSNAVPVWGVDELLNLPELADGYHMGDIGSSKVLLKCHCDTYITSVVYICELLILLHIIIIYDIW